MATQSTYHHEIGASDLANPDQEKARVARIGMTLAFHLSVCKPEVSPMASSRQRTAARKNIRRAASAARRRKTISKLPKRTRTALGKQGAKVARQKRKARR